MIGRLIERLFVQVRADMSDLSRDLQQGVAQTTNATRKMATSWSQVQSRVESLTRDFKAGKIAQAQYVSGMNQLSSSMKAVAGSYAAAQREVWGYAKAANAAKTTTAIAMDTAPIVAFSRSTGQARMQMMNLGYQINDIGMTLATGMNPMTVLIQQGSQIVQIYAGQGGVKAALGDLGTMLTGLVKKARPLLILAAAFEGLRYEINKTAEVTVSYGDTVKAVFQVLYGYIQGPMTKAFKFLADLWEEVWGTIVEQVKKEGNRIIRAVLIMKAGISAAVQDIPGFFRAAFLSAAAAAMEGLYKLGAKIEEFMGGVATVMNETFGTSLDTNPVYDWVSGLDAARYQLEGLASAAKENSAAWQEFEAEASRISNTDYMGKFFEDVKDQAVQNALDRIADGVEDVGGAARKAAQEVKDMMKELEDGLQTAADNLAQVFGNAFERLAETGRFTFSDFIQDLNQLIIKSTSELLQEELSNMFKALATSKGGLGSMFSNLFTGLFGGGLPGRARGGVEMPWRSFIAGEEGAELITQDGPAGARRVTTAGQTRAAMVGAGSYSGPPINIYVQTPDVEGFRKSQPQIASQLSGFIAKGGRNQ